MSSSDDNIESFNIYGNDGVDIVLNLCDKVGKEIAHVVIEDSQYLLYGHDFCDLEVRDAKKVEISGDKCNLRDVVISSDSLEVCSKNVNIRRLNYMGDKVNFNDSNGNIKIVSLNGVSLFKIKNCSFESKDASFDIALTPVIKDSAWMFDYPLRYNKGTIGNEDSGFIMDDDTFNKDKCIDLGRAHLSFVLSKIKDKIEDKIDDKFDLVYECISKDLDDLKSEYEQACDKLSQIANNYETKLQRDQIKKYVLSKK